MFKKFYVNDFSYLYTLVFTFWLLFAVFLFYFDGDDCASTTMNSLDDDTMLATL